MDPLVHHGCARNTWRAAVQWPVGELAWRWADSMPGGGNHQSGYGSIPMKIPFLVGWTSINPSYFDVNKKGVLLVLTHCHLITLIIIFHMIFLIKMTINDYQIVSKIYIYICLNDIERLLGVSPILFDAAIRPWFQCPPTCCFRSISCS